MQELSIQRGLKGVKVNIDSYVKVVTCSRATDEMAPFKKYILVYWFHFPGVTGVTSALCIYMWPVDNSCWDGYLFLLKHTNRNRLVSLHC